jgi:LPS export ABC transporter permease LptG/LPS export ABC transporter permease LptF
MLGFPEMRGVDKLLNQATVPPFLISLAVLTFVGLNYNLGRLSELLITRNASPEAVLIIGGTLLPGIMIFTLPLSFLIGTLIGLSGLSGESQITALRACGVSMRRMFKPIVALAGMVGLLTALLSLIILPETNDVYDSIRDLISVRQVVTEIVPRVFNESFANVVFYLDDLSVDRQRWDRVFLADNSEPAAPRIVLAREGTWMTDQGGSRLQLHLEHGTIYEVNAQDPTKDNVSRFASTDIPIAVSREAGSEGANTDVLKRPAEQSTLNLLQGSKQTNVLRRREELIELHKRLALPCSVLGFALVGLSLGICTRRGGRTAGSVLSMVLVILYYILFMDGLRLANIGTLPPWLGSWGADIILIGVGIALLVNMEQSNWLSRWSANWRWRNRLEPVVNKFHLGSVRSAVQRLDDLAVFSTRRVARSSLPKVLDSYVSRGFFVYFLWSTLVCYSLFVLLTLFDLLDEIIRNRIPAGVVIRYFVFLTPQILIYVVPMGVLLATLILFGILEKGSEVTAMKAGGWSLYRIAIPVFLVASFLSANLYLLQDYVIPYANIRQDALRNQIKGRPPQTITKPRKWIFGESGRIFNYDYFDPNQDMFIGLNVYEVDFHQLTIKRRFYAKQATVTAAGQWTLESGWLRDFQADRVGFVPITKATFAFSEQASYFKKELFAPKESSKMTYFKLKNYINDLKKSGYNATELQVELYKKISFPLSCFVMSLLGIPFSFSMGKRGAFFGITASVAIAMSYWGIFSVFEQMGTYGLLSPLLAAWAPNIVFGAAGLALLFTIRT